MAVELPPVSEYPPIVHISIGIKGFILLVFKKVLNISSFTNKWLRPLSTPELISPYIYLCEMAFVRHNIEWW